MFTALLPKGAPFFELLLQQNDVLCKMTETTVQILENFSDIDKPHKDITRLEEEGDRLHQAVTWHLSQTFITPIDREDILHINKEQEEAIDMIYDMANRLYIFAVPRIRFPMLRLSKKLQELAIISGAMLKGLSEKRDSHNSKEFGSVREECDMLLSMGLVELYDIENPTPSDILDIMKGNQVYWRLELSLRQMARLAESIEEAVLKSV